MSDVDVGSASPPTADVQAAASDIELAMSHYSAARVTALEVYGGDSSRWHEAGIAAVWTLARGCAYEDAAKRVRAGHMCPGCGHRDEATHSGVAGEPEATTPKVILSEACGPHCIDGYCCGDRANPQINSPVSSTQDPTPTPDGPAAADVAGGVVVPDEAVRAYIRGACGPDAVLPEGSPFWHEIATGLAAAAPLIVEHYLRHRIKAAEVDQTPEEVWEQVRQVARNAAIRTAVVDALRSAAGMLRTQINTQWGIGDAVVYLLRRADELERGTDR